jgi:hypothetical protein
MSTSTVRRPAPPVTCDCEWVSPPETIALRLRCGASAALTITRQGRPEGYVLSPNTTEAGELVGYRLENATSGKLYDLPADLSDCDCGDRVHRHRTCKHMLALARLLAASASANAA